MDSEFLEHAPNLKFIARSGAGMENIDEDYCAKRNIDLHNAPEGNRNAVGEHALGMLLALFNKLHTADAEVRNGKWDREGNRGVELDGTEFVQEVELEILFEKADVLSFHIPQNEETIFFANDAFFNSFEQPIYLINLARGKVVQISALVNAMKSNKVLGACLDVLEYEKASFESFFEQDLDPNFSFLLKSSDVIFSPHVGGWTHESYFKLSNVLADKILRTV
jgi:D-3-phosphoglycerate dehydrogenase